MADHWPIQGAILNAHFSGQKLKGTWAESWKLKTQDKFYTWSPWYWVDARWKRHTSLDLVLVFCVLKKGFA